MRNVSRLAVCLGYVLAHCLVVTFLRIKFSRYGAPGPDDNNGVAVVPLEHFVDFHAQREGPARGSLSGSQLPFPAGTDNPSAGPAVAGRSDSAACAIGLPAYSLPMLYAVVGACEPDCICPYCCLAGATDVTGCLAALGRPSAAAAAAAAARDSPDVSRITRDCMWRRGLNPSAHVDELYLPGALLPEAAALGVEEVRGRGPSGAQVSRQAADLAPLPTPSPSPSASSSARARFRVARAEPADSAGRLLPFSADEPPPDGLAVGVPVPPALQLVEGIPLADVLRWRRAAARGGGSTAVNGPVAAEATRSGELTAAVPGTPAVSAASRTGDQQLLLQGGLAGEPVRSAVSLDRGVSASGGAMATAMVAMPGEDAAAGGGSAAGALPTAVGAAGGAAAGTTGI